MNDLDTVEAALAKAACPEDVFGALADAAALKRTYHRLATTVHPDHFTAAPDILRAQAAFHGLTQWRAQAETKIAAGTYGDRAPVAPPEPPPPTHAPQIIQTPKRKYVVTDRLAQGDIADLYRCSFTEGGTEHSAVFKLARSAADNDFAENENRVLSAMYPAKQAEVDFYRYLPKPVDSFLLKGKRNRRVNVLQLADGYVSLADVMRVYPSGLDYRDAAWMFKRALAALYFVHKMHVVHGAILPPHVLVHPVEHGAKLVDWSYAVHKWERKATHVKAISKTHRPYYAPEILKKQPPTPQTDILMLAKCMIALLGGKISDGSMPDAVPKPIRMFLAGCNIDNPARRPDDAGRLHQDFDEILKRLVGKPTYRRLDMSAK